MLTWSVGADALDCDEVPDGATVFTTGFGPVAEHPAVIEATTTAQDAMSLDGTKPGRSFTSRTR